MSLAGRKFAYLFQRSHASNIACMSSPFGSDAIGTTPALPRPKPLDAFVLELRQLALAALDAGQPMAAVLIAGTADRLEATIPSQPARPTYP
jgi:hypothetical protein